MRTVITGIGVVSPFRIGRERFWTCVRARCSATRVIPEFEALGLPCQVAALLPEISLQNLPPVEGERHPEAVLLDVLVLSARAAPRSSGR